MHTMAKKLNLCAMENCVCFNLRWVTRAVTQFFDAEMRRHGVRPTQTPILASLNARAGWTMAELSDWLGMERTTLVRNLGPLERDGLVKLSGSGRGGKVTLSVTGKGKVTFARLLPVWRAAQQKVVDTLGAARWSAILSDLERAALALTK